MTRIDCVRGRGMPLAGDDIDTDRIIPARFLKAVTFEGLEQHLFEDDRASNPTHPVSDPRYRGASILLVNRNFGCGSSREHAPQAIARLGIRAIVGESFSEIFFGNSVAIGLPCVTAARGEIQAFMERVTADPLLEIAVDLADGTVTAGGLRVTARLPPGTREAFLSGAWDATGLLRGAEDDVRRLASTLPYLRDFDAS